MAAHYLDGTLKSARRILGIHVHGHTGRIAKCVKGKLSGTKPGSREAARAQLASAARSCAGK